MSEVADASVIDLPALDLTTGCLPPGRYPATLDGVRAAFVEAPALSASKTRPDRWSGFLAYISAWEQIEGLLGERIVLAWWIGGSFVSSVIEVEDIDITPVLDREVWKRKSGSL